MTIRRFSAFLSFVACLPFTIIAGCDQSSVEKQGGGQSPSIVAQRVSRGVAAIAQGPARNIQQFKLNDNAACVFLIGENHASVLSQKQETQVIGQLLDATAVDAVLMEGSHGPLSVPAFSKRLTNAVADPGAAQKYWDRELSAGRIGAAEYVALTRPTIQVFGVEEMSAKAKMQIAYTLDPPGSLQHLKESHNRGYSILENGLKGLNVSGKIEAKYISRIQLELQAYRAAADAAEMAAAAYGGKAKPLTDMSVQLINASARAQTLAAALKEDFGIYEKNVEIVKAAEKPIEELRRNAEEYDRLVSAVKQGDRLSAMKAKRLKRTIDEAEAALSPVVAAKADIESFTSRADVNQLIALESEIKTGLAERDKLSESLKGFIDASQAAEIAVRDAYGVAANDESWVAASSNLKLEGVNSFYRDEAAITEREQTGVTHDAELRERDIAMAANTAEFLKGGKKCVVLIVGAAHLDDLTQELKSHGMSVVRADLPGNDGPTSTWEVRNYQQRLNPNFARLFSNSSGGSILPEFQITRPEWQEERLALVLSLKQVADLPPARWSSEPVSDLIKGRDVVIRAGPECDFPEADFGKQVVDKGTVPSRPDWGFEAYDREAARQLAATQSDRDTVFAYYYRLTSGPSRGGRVVTPDGEKTVREFVSRTPLSKDGSKPKRIVLFGEPDERNEGGVLVSPTWRSVRGGGIEAPIAGNSRTSALGPEHQPGEESFPNSNSGGGRGGRGGGEGGRGGGNGGGEGGLGGAHDGGPGGNDVNRDSVWGAVFTSDPHERLDVYRTINPERAKRNLEALDKQDPLHLGPVQVIEEANLLEGLEHLPFTPTRGDHSQTLVIVAHNGAEFRRAVAIAARAGKLANKQIALITCGDAFRETAQLRELLLDEGALMVWVPDRQITPEAAAALRTRVVKMSDSLPPELRPAKVDGLINRCLQEWHQEDPLNPDLLSFELAAAFVEGPPAPPEFDKEES